MGKQKSSWSSLTFKHSITLVWPHVSLSILDPSCLFHPPPHSCTSKPHKHTCMGQWSSKFIFRLFCNQAPLLDHIQITSKPNWYDPSHAFEDYSREIIKLQMSYYLQKLSTRLASAGSSSLITSWCNVIVHTPSYIWGKGGLWKKSSWTKLKLTPASMFSSTSTTFHSFCRRLRFARENLFLLDPLPISGNHQLYLYIYIFRRAAVMPFMLWEKQKQCISR